MQKGPNKIEQLITEQNRHPATERLTYSRAFLMQLRDSPLAQGYPVGANTIPGIIEPPTNTEKKKHALK